MRWQHGPFLTDQATAQRNLDELRGAWAAAGLRDVTPAEPVGPNVAEVRFIEPDTRIQLSAAFYRSGDMGNFVASVFSRCVQPVMGGGG
ncbi:hypothetical protein [Yinghuangia soli]|uniref:Uncharacterized protein n=1 Tax=Yinghuangia soli TaxID=2908204 RepID=A0AA41QAK8_9ACTN|nr:hypothetical protein [Yinghuangia soli]MCF2533945.1 hypothetical protein [Yinghuangia soli]